MRRWKEFDYSYQWDAQGSTIGYRPIITIVLNNGTNSIRVNGLVDSGCDSVMIEAAIAEELGIRQDPSSPRIAVGGVAGSRRDAFKQDVTVKVAEFEKFLTNATFVPDLPFACILGQRGFFDSFDVRFEKREDKFYIRPIT
jgi:hypothetical protein